MCACVYLGRCVSVAIVKRPALPLYVEDRRCRNFHQDDDDDENDPILQAIGSRAGVRTFDHGGLEASTEGDTCVVGGLGSYVATGTGIAPGGSSAAVMLAVVVCVGFLSACRSDPAATW